LIVVNAKSLVHVCFANNGLQQLPERELKQTTQLASLDLSFNKLEALPEVIGSLSQLRKLEINNNSLSFLGAAILNRCTNVEMLHFHHNKITAITEPLDGLQRLRVLDLSSNQLKTVPEAVLVLKALETLDLSGNAIESCEINMSSLCQLRVMKLARNNLRQVSITSDSLEELDLSCNHLNAPPVFSALPGLKLLNVNHCHLHEVPESVTKLSMLKWVDLRRNHIQNLPASLATIHSLDCLLVDVHHGSALQHPPRNVCRKGTPAILKYLREHQANPVSQRVQLEKIPKLSDADQTLVASSLNTATTKIKHYEHLIQTFNSPSSAQAQRTYLDVEAQNEHSLIDYLVSMGPHRYFVQPIPSHVVFQVATTWHDSGEDARATRWLTEFTALVQRDTGRDDVDVDTILFWLANAHHLNIQAHHGWLGKNVDLQHKFAALSEAVYHKLMKTLQNTLSPIIVSAMVVDDAHVPTSPVKTGTFARSNTSRFRSAFDSILHCMSTTHDSCQKYLFHPQIVAQIFNQLYYFIDAVMINSLLLRKKLCNHGHAGKIGSNVKVLEEWAASRQLQLNVGLRFTRSAVALLKLPLKHSSSKDAEGVIKAGYALSIGQIEKLLRNVLDTVDEEWRVAVRQHWIKQHPNSDVSEQLFLDTFQVSPLIMPDMKPDQTDSVHIPKSFEIPFIVKQQQ
jgi:Leucine-rich repeat (LRR) protein